MSIENITQKYIDFILEILRLDSFREAVKTLSEDMLKSGQGEKLDEITIPTRRYSHFLKRDNREKHGKNLFQPFNILLPLFILLIMGLTPTLSNLGDDRSAFLTLFPITILSILSMGILISIYVFIFEEEKRKAKKINLEKEIEKAIIAEEIYGDPVENKGKSNECTILSSIENGGIELKKQETKKESQKEKKARIKKEIKKIISRKNNKKFKKLSSDEWNYTKIAQELKIGRNTVSKYMKEMGL